MPISTCFGIRLPPPYLLKPVETNQGPMEVIVVGSAVDSRSNAGAGLAGASAAYHLVQHGVQVTLLESGDVGEGSSVETVSRSRALCQRRSRALRRACCGMISIYSPNIGS